MALKANDEQHAKQIKAGAQGRKKGHKFEKIVVDEINKMDLAKVDYNTEINHHMFRGNPAVCLVMYIAKDRGEELKSVKGYWLGGLATANDGDGIIDGQEIKGSKSDILFDIEFASGKKEMIGISAKACSNNAQMALTSASVFCTTLRNLGIEVSENAEAGLKMFCGDTGYRPMDNYKAYNMENISSKRKARPERWYWEELSTEVQKEWEELISDNQVLITKLLLQKANAYKSDKYLPEYILHECKKHVDINECEMSIMSIDELAKYSKQFDGFGIKKQKIRKGTYKDIDTAMHEYPHFGFVQFQPIGNKQNFSELQFNLMASYYKKIAKMLLISVMSLFLLVGCGDIETIVSETEQVEIESVEEIDTNGNGRRIIVKAEIVTQIISDRMSMYCKL